jgi:Fe-S-cluster-containing hydrogenase component 2
MLIPTKETTMEDDAPVVDENICIGCGVCLLHCPGDAAKLKRKDDSVPFEDFKTLHRAALGESMKKGG